MEYNMPEIQVRDQMSPRDFFAGCALAGLLATPNEEQESQAWEDVCEEAYKGADWMMRQRGD